MLILVRTFQPGRVIPVPLAFYRYQNKMEWLAGTRSIRFTLALALRFMPVIAWECRDILDRIKLRGFRYDITNSHNKHDRISEICV